MLSRLDWSPSRRAFFQAESRPGVCGGAPWAQVLPEGDAQAAGSAGWRWGGGGWRAASYFSYCAAGSSEKRNLSSGSLLGDPHRRGRDGQARGPHSRPVTSPHLPRKLSAPVLRLIGRGRGTVREQEQWTPIWQEVSPQ